ncbi:MAG: hypothetical protein ACFFC7_27650 [Candidatus Hermodarchaeota archaeon]
MSSECYICKASDVSLLYATHKEANKKVSVCQPCWEKLWETNSFVSGTTCSSSSCGSRSSCSNC